MYRERAVSLRSGMHSLARARFVVVVIVVATALASTACDPPLFSGTIGVELTTADGVDRERVAVGIFGTDAGGLATDPGVIVEDAPPRCLPYGGDGASIPTPDPLAVTPAESIPPNATMNVTVEPFITGPMALVAWFDGDEDGALTLGTTLPSEQCRVPTRDIDGRAHALVALQFREDNERDRFDALAAPIDDPSESFFINDAQADGWTIALDAETDEP